MIELCMEVRSGPRIGTQWIKIVELPHLALLCNTCDSFECLAYKVVCGRIMRNEIDSERSNRFGWNRVP